MELGGRRHTTRTGVTGRNPRTGRISQQIHQLGVTQKDVFSAYRYQRLKWRVPEASVGQKEPIYTILGDIPAVMTPS